MSKYAISVLLLSAAMCRADFSFSIDPTPQTVALGSQVTFTLDTAGFGNGTTALGTYDLLITFDPTVLNFDNATFGTDLDPDGFGLNPQTVTQGTGTVEIAEVSLDPAADLLSQQPAAFTLATVVFDTLGAATNSALVLSEFAIGDQDGNDISVASVLNGASVNVSQSSGVPEPATITLLSGGVLLLIAIRSRIRRTR